MARCWGRGRGGNSYCFVVKKANGKVLADLSPKGAEQNL